MRKILMTLVIFLSMLSFGKAQDYNTGIGFRGGLPGGLTIKHFVTRSHAVEGIISSRWCGLNITGLYEIHNDFEDVIGLSWYYGFGAHIGFWNGDKVDWGKPNRSYTVIGLDGVIGLEYVLAEAPISIGLDWKPAMNIIDYSGFWGDGAAVSIRYLF
ncbi:MAG: hypothetical protein WBG43_04180 [Marinifilaceae bacterium]